VIGAPPSGARVVVVGNEKGGSGKSTIAMHLAVALLKAGQRVATIDLDARQGTLSRFVDNRRRAAEKAPGLLIPDHAIVERSAAGDRDMAEMDERARFTTALDDARARHDFVVVDTPGSDTFLSQLAHSHADVIVTPINDSFVDLDVIALVDGESLEVLRPSHYAVLVWEQKKQRAKRDRRAIDWIVLRNRLSHVDARNKRQIGQVLAKLSRRLGFRLAGGFSERVVFRELFLKGLTLLDVREPGAGVELNMSHVAARAELTELLETMGLMRDEAATEAAAT
jgi:chromosome partitioning protein